MNPRELVDHHVRSGPVELVLDVPLRFAVERVPTRAISDTFFKSCKPAKRFEPCSVYNTEDEWVRLIKTLGSIKDIQYLAVFCTAGSHDFHPFQAVADALNNAHSLSELQVILNYETLPRDTSELIALANALRERTSLQNFTWFDLHSSQDVSPDPVLRALLDCPFLQFARIMTKYAGADAIRNLLELLVAIELELTLLPEHWLAVADELRRGHFHARVLSLCMIKEHNRRTLKLSKQ
jgi:hypothetical protein